MTETRRRIISGVSALAFLGTTYLPNLISGDLSWFSTSALVDSSASNDATPSILFSKENNGVDCTVEETNFVSDATFGFGISGKLISASNGNDNSTDWEGTQSLFASNYIWDTTPVLGGTATYTYPYWQSNRIGDVRCINVSTRKNGSIVHCFEDVESITYTDASTGETVTIKETSAENDFVSYCADNNHDMSPSASQTSFKLWDITAVASDMADIEASGGGSGSVTGNYDEVLQVCSRGYHAILANSYPLVSYDIDGESFTDTEKRYITQVALRLWRIYIMGWGRNADFSDDVKISMDTYLNNRGETEATIKMRYEYLLSTLTVAKVPSKCTDSKADAALDYLKLLMEEAMKCELGTVSEGTSTELNKTLKGWNGEDSRGVQTDFSVGITSGVDYYNDNYSVSHVSSGELMEDGSSTSGEATINYSAEGTTDSDGNTVYDVVTLSDGSTYLALGKVTPSTSGLSNYSLEEEFTLNGLLLDDNGEIVWINKSANQAQVDDSVCFSTTELSDNSSSALLKSEYTINNSNLDTEFYIYKELEGDTIPLSWKVKVGVADGQTSQSTAEITDALAPTYQLAFLECTSGKAYDSDIGKSNTAQDLIAFIKNSNATRKTLKVSVSSLEFSGETDISTLVIDKRFFYGDEYSASSDISSSLEQLRTEVECVIKNSDGKYFKGTKTLGEDGSYNYSWTGWADSVSEATVIEFAEDSSLQTSISPIPSGTYEVYEKNGFQSGSDFNEDNLDLSEMYSFTGFKVVGPAGDDNSTPIAGVPTVSVAKDEKSTVSLYNQVNFDKLEFEKTFVLSSSQKENGYEELAEETKFVVMRQESDGSWVEQAIVPISLKDANGNYQEVLTLRDNETGVSGEFSLSEGTSSFNSSGDVTYSFSWNYVETGTYRFYEVSMLEELSETFKLQGTNSGYDEERGMSFIEVTTDNNPSVATVGEAVNTSQQLTLMVNKKWTVNGSDAELSDSTTNEVYQEAYEEFKNNTYFCLAISANGQAQQYLTLEDVEVDEATGSVIGDSKGASTTTVKMANVDSIANNAKVYTLDELCEGTTITINPNATYNGTPLSELDSFTIDLYECTDDSLIIEKEVSVSSSATSKVTYEFDVNQSSVDDGTTDNDTLTVALSSGFSRTFNQVGRVTGSFSDGESQSLQLVATNNLETDGTVIIKKTGQQLVGSGDSPAIVGAGFTLFKQSDIDALIDVTQWNDESLEVVLGAVADGTLVPASEELSAIPTDGDGDGNSNGSGDFSLCTFEGVLEGEYYAIETTVPNGYRGTSPTMVLSKGGQTQVSSVVNAVETAHLSVVKFEGDSSPQQLTKETVDSEQSIARIAGVTFALIPESIVEENGWSPTSSSNNTWNYSAILNALGDADGPLPEGSYQVASTDSNGIATFGDLRKGASYIAVELSSSSEYEVSKNISDRFLTGLTPGTYTDPLWGTIIDGEMVAAYYNTETTYSMSLSKYVEDSLQGVSLNSNDDESDYQWNSPISASFGWSTTDWEPSMSTLGDTFYRTGQFQRDSDGRVQYSYETNKTYYVEAPSDSVKFKVAHLVSGASTEQIVSQNLDLPFTLGELDATSIAELYGSGSQDTWEVYEYEFTLGHSYKYDESTKSWSEIEHTGSDSTVYFEGIDDGIYLAFETWCDTSVAGHLAETPVMLSVEKSTVDGTVVIDGEDTEVKQVFDKAIFNVGDGASALLFKSYQELDEYADEESQRLAPEEEETYEDSKGVTYFDVPGLDYESSSVGNGKASGDAFGLFKVVKNGDSYSAELVDLSNVTFNMTLSQYCVGFTNFDKTHDGWYFIREVSVNEGYELDPYCYFFTVTEDDNAGEDREDFLPSILGEEGYDSVSTSVIGVNKYNVSTKFRKVADGDELNFLKETDRTSEEYNSKYPMIGVNDLLSYVTHDEETGTWVYSNTWKESYAYEYLTGLGGYDSFRTGYLASINSITPLSKSSTIDASIVQVEGNVYKVGLNSSTTLGEKDYGDYSFVSFEAVTGTDGEYGVSNKATSETTTTTTTTSTSVTTTPTTSTSTSTVTSGTTTPTTSTSTLTSTGSESTTTSTSTVTGSESTTSTSTVTGSESTTTTTSTTTNTTTTPSTTTTLTTTTTGSESTTTNSSATTITTTTGSESTTTDSSATTTPSTTTTNSSVTTTPSTTTNSSVTTTPSTTTTDSSVTTTAPTGSESTTTPVSESFNTVTSATTLVSNETLGDVIGQLPSLPSENTTSGSGTVINRVDGQGNLLDSDGNVMGESKTPERDADGNLVLYIDENGNVTDSNGTILNISVDSEVVNGALVVTTDENGNLVDSKGNLVYNSEQPKTDANGNVIQYVDSQGNIVDSTGSIISGTSAPEKDANGNLKVHYDENGHLVDSNGTVLHSSLDVEFDENGNLVVSIDENGNLVNSKGEILYINGDLDLTGSLVITKEDENGMKLDNATFEVYDSEGNLVTTLTTGSNSQTGYGYVDALEFGEYSWIETVAPTGYGGSEEDKTVTSGTFTIDAIGESIHITVENSKLTSELSVKKVTRGEDGRSVALSGAQFELFDEEGNSLGVKVTGSDGIASWSDVTTGEYSIKEVTAPEGYTLREEPIEVDFNGTTDVVISFADAPTDFNGGLILRKYDFVTGEAVAGAEFVITDKETGETWSGTTDADGNLYCEDTDGSVTVNGFDMIVGHSYTYQETTAPDGYKVNETVGEFSFSANGVVVYCEMEDLRESEEVQIQKVSAESLKTLGGATIGVFSSDDQLILKGVTTPDGLLTITDVTYSFEGYAYNLGDNTFEMPAGEYYYMELEAPQGYVLDDTKYEFTVEGDKSDVSTFILKNTGGKGTIVINKTDLTGAVEVEGAVIGLYVKNGSEYELYEDYQGVTSLINGEASVVFESIPEGTYYFHEELAPTGYIRDTAYYEITVSNGVISHGTITNELDDNASLDGSNGSITGDVTTVPTGASGSVVTVTNEDGSPVTDSDGSVVTSVVTTLGEGSVTTTTSSSSTTTTTSTTTTNKITTTSSNSPTTGDGRSLLKIGGAMLVASITSLLCRRKKKNNEEVTIEDNEEL